MKSRNTFFKMSNNKIHIFSIFDSAFSLDEIKNLSYENLQILIDKSYRNSELTYKDLCELKKYLLCGDIPVYKRSIFEAVVSEDDIGINAGGNYYFKKNVLSPNHIIKIYPEPLSYLSDVGLKWRDLGHLNPQQKIQYDDLEDLYEKGIKNPCFNLEMKPSNPDNKIHVFSIVNSSFSLYEIEHLSYKNLLTFIGGHSESALIYKDLDAFKLDLSCDYNPGGKRCIFEAVVSEDDIGLAAEYYYFKKKVLHPSNIVNIYPEPLSYLSDVGLKLRDLGRLNSQQEKQYDKLLNLYAKGIKNPYYTLNTKQADNEVKESNAKRACLIC